MEHTGDDEHGRATLAGGPEIASTRGLHQIYQGVDSGSPKILQLMNKTFQDFDQIYESAARCLAAGVRPSFNIIFAVPGEGAKERRETVSFMMDVCRRFPGAEFWTNIFTPILALQSCSARKR
jgi:radical SAM superfamily enzyme YgiQ (UPF0313 family)